MRVIWVGGKAHSILLRRYYNALIAPKVLETCQNILYVLLFVVVMVGEDIDFDFCGKVFEMAHERAGIAYPGNGKDAVARSEPVEVGDGRSNVREDGLQGHVLEAREEEMLRGEELVVLYYHAVVDRPHVFGTFGDHNYIGSVYASRGLAQAPVRQHFVVVDGSVVLRDEDRDGGLDVAVLESVVEKDEVELRVEAAQLANAEYTVFADGDGNASVEFVINLICLVAYVLRRGCAPGNDEPLGLAAVAAAQYGHFPGAPESVREVFDQRCLSRPSDGEIADGDDWYVEFHFLQHFPVEHFVARVGDCAIDFGTWQQYHLGKYGAAFHRRMN